MPNRRIRLGRLEAEIGRSDELNRYVPSLTEEDRENFSKVKDELITYLQESIREGKELPTRPSNPGTGWLLIERLIDIAFNREQARLRSEARQTTAEITQSLLKGTDNKNSEANETFGARLAGIQVARLPAPVACAK